MKVNEQPLFVSDPITNEDGIYSFISYTLQGSRLPEPLSRRYSDFDALRKKMLERWPGIFIPNIPHKKLIGNQDKEVVGLRIQTLNVFLKKISKIDYLYNSVELKAFLENSNDVKKTLDSIKPETNEELLRRYSKSFTDHDENFGFVEARKEQVEFYKNLIESYPKMKEFRHFVYQEKQNYLISHQNDIRILNLITIYEKDILNGFADQDENKLILYNMKNIELTKGINNLQEKMLNPYDRLYQSLTEELLETEAMKDALEGLNQLNDSYTKLTSSLTSINIELNDLQAGKTSFKNFFSSREDSITNLMKQQEKLESEIETLGKIINFATFDMSKQMKNFKTKSLKHYYGELSRINKDLETNGKITDELWENVCKNQNIAPIV